MHDESVRGIAMTTLPAPIVMSRLNQQPVVSSFVGWIATGSAVGVTALVIACMIALIDRLLGARRGRSHLLNLGVSPQQLRLLEALSFALPYAIVALGGLVTGFVICANMVGSGIASPWPAIGAITAGALTAGVVGAVAMAALGDRMALHKVE
jgi:hypothetical protein